MMRNYGFEDEAAMSVILSWSIDQKRRLAGRI